jgi:hypothetical protein
MISWLASLGNIIWSLAALLETLPLVQVLDLRFVAAALIVEVACSVVPVLPA